MSAESDGGYSALVTRVGGCAGRGGAGWGGAGAGMHLLYCPTLSCCSALRPGPGPSNSEHNTGSDPPAILMLGNIFPPAILIVGDKIPPAIQMLPTSCLGTNFHRQPSFMLGDTFPSLRQYNFVKSELQFCRTPRPTRFLRKGRQWQVNAE